MFSLKPFIAPMPNIYSLELKMFCGRSPKPTWKVFHNL